MSEFDEYIVHGEPRQKEKADAWQTAIVLQNVDGLKVSTYLLDTARQHIEVSHNHSHSDTILIFKTTTH